MPLHQTERELTPAEWEAEAIRLTPEQERAIERMIFVPATRCSKHDMFEMHANIGGRYRLTTVEARGTPYEDNYGQNRRATYVDVVGPEVGRTKSLLGKLLVKASRYEPQGPQQNLIPDNDILEGTICPQP